MEGVIRVPQKSGHDVLVAAADMVAGPILSGASGSADDRTGVMVWAGAHDMCNFLSSSVAAQMFRGRSVVELGIGAGLTTILLSRLSSCVIGSDCNHEALALAARTISLNGADQSVSLVRYDWNSDEASTFRALLPEARPLIIAAAEIVYPSTATESLDALFASVTNISLLARSDHCPFVMAYVQRRPDTTLRMLASAWKAGFTWEIIPWTEYASAQSPMATKMFIFKQSAHDLKLEEFEAALDASLPDLHEQVQAARTAELEAQEEASTFVLPFAPEES
jgi:hypothetical protein